MFIQSELKCWRILLAVDTRSDFTSKKKSKDNNIYTVPVCSVAQGERTTQKPQVEDSLWEIQHPDIVAHKVILQEQGRGINTPGGSFMIFRAKRYRNCIGPGRKGKGKGSGKGNGKFTCACSTASTTGPGKRSHNKHSSSYREDRGRAPPCQKDAVFHTSVVQIWKANCSLWTKHAVQYVAKAKPWLCLVQNKGVQL